MNVALAVPLFSDTDPARRKTTMTMRVRRRRMRMRMRMMRRRKRRKRQPPPNKRVQHPAKLKVSPAALTRARMH